MAATLLLALVSTGTLCSAQVSVSEETMVLPTYPTEAPDRIPLFFRPEEVQLAEKHVYPYPFYGVQSAEKADREYRAVVLENEYLKICVTPEMGGRLYYAVDKTNGYQIVYNNRVVKPALIGTIGAWTSGGVEWNTPHHHRATSLLDVDHTVVENPDGSKTVWVGEYEKRSQTRWLTGMTLEPGRAYVKITFKSMNVTPYEYPALCFANVAVHVNDSYQFVFPPDVEMMNFHYVTEFTRWPVLNQVYQSVDYTKGEDLSWWKETRQPVSFFVTKTAQDFMGGIDHGKGAGIALVGDHRIFKGKKLWNWGKNEVQEVWDTKLTDEDGPYAELMMGFYSDNQPDYNFVAPFETKYGDMYLYGIKGLDGIKEATRDFALNLDLKEGLAQIQLNATAAFQGVQIALRRGDTTVFTDTADISPEQPYAHEAPAGGAESLEELRVQVLDAEGRELLAWQKQPAKNEPFPEVYRDPLEPREYKTAQELFYAGLKLEQFGNTNFDYMKYYEAALALEPDHVPTNTQIGLVFLKRGELDRAEEHLARAVGVVTDNHKKAQDATALFYLGVCRLRQGRTDDALELLYRATWDYPWTSAGYTLAAQAEAARGNIEKALDNAERAVRANTQNIEALCVKTIILRTLGNAAAAADTARQALEVDPLCFTALNELRLLAGTADTGKTAGEWANRLARCLRNEPYNYIETSARYAAAGRFGEAVEFMGLAAASPDAALSANPMTHYHLALYLDRAGRGEEAAAALEKAAGLPIDLCFPYGEESERALHFALSADPGDAKAHYLLGNLLANFRHAEAVACWQAALDNGFKDAVVYRNLAYLQANHLDRLPEALDNIMTAISLDPKQKRYFAEADLYMSYASLTPEQLAEFLAEYGEMGRDIVDIQLMEVKLAVFRGEYDRAIELLTAMRYHIEEGATFNPHVHWFDAHLQKGIGEMNAGRHREAEALFLKAMEFPANLEAERNGKTGIAHYYLGVNQRLAGDAEAARGHFTAMLDYTPPQGWGAGDFPEIGYFKALAARELGHNADEIDKRFRQLIEDGEKRLAPAKDGRHITVTVEEEHTGRTFLLERELARKDLRVSSYHLQGLGHLGLGDKEQARAFFQKALEVDPLAVDPKLMLESMKE
ncbi:MAG TPA: DUF5107 domain-containing protein [Candidatus Hydrogenedentes bacterium]|nr:DUF5107 domain-containing protein [Candidatus Hydrogenedentota bacterium]